MSLLEPRFIAPRDGLYHLGHGPVHHEDDCTGQPEITGETMLVSFGADQEDA